MDIKWSSAVCATFLSAIACAPSEHYADLFPSEAKALNPSGIWMRHDGKPIKLSIYRDPKGAWVVESSGKAPAGPPQNACWRVHSGVLNSGEMIVSSDLDRDFHGQLNRDSLRPYNGLYLTFKRGAVIVTGPEAEDEICRLAGTYIHQK